MGKLDDFVKRIEKNCGVKFISGSYNVDKGWDPIKVKLTPQQLNNFIQKFTPSGEFNGVKYQVNSDGTVNFYHGKGVNIEKILLSLK